MSATRRQNNGHFGIHDLPEQQQRAMHKAIRLERISIVVRIFVVALIFSLAGSSQAMKASWIEDSLALLPPLAFLIALRFIKRRPTPRHPYGYHRAMGVGHLVAAVALLTLGSYLLVDSAMGLAKGEHPPIGVMNVFGTPVWAGWFMAAASLVVVIPSVILGHKKTKLAPHLHNKLLFADADMDKADWMTGTATGLGILGVGAGIWWLDSAAAIFISFDILYDGFKNLRGSLGGLIDARATTTDNKNPHENIDLVREELLKLDWVDEVDLRLRDQGQVFHSEVFVVPVNLEMPTLQQLEDAREMCRDLDWKLHDLVIIPVSELPDEFLPQIAQQEL